MILIAGEVEAIDFHELPQKSKILELLMRISKSTGGGES